MVLKKLARKWKRSLNGKDIEDRDFPLPIIDDTHPIDTLEQEEQVRSLEKIQAQQSFLWRAVFATLLCCLVLFFIFSIYQQTAYPWELKYHAYFMEEIDSWVVILADCVGALSCLMAVMGLIYDTKNRRRLIWYSCYASILLAIFWLYYVIRMPKFRWHVMWLPFGPLWYISYGLIFSRISFI